MQLTINGRRVEFEPGQTILETAEAHGLEIPTLCHLKRAYPIQSCQICLVEVAGRQTLLPACATPADAGLDIRTDSVRVHEARRSILQMLAASIRHPHPVRNQAGDAALNRLLTSYQVPLPLEQATRDTDTAPFATPDIAYRPEHCILCHRCVVACRELKGIGAIEIIKEHGRSRVVPYRPELCESCGECLMTCPTMALTDAVSPQGDRVWSGEKTLTTCGYCGCGCQLEINTDQGRVMGMSTPFASGVNQGSLCVKGRFGYEFIGSQDRLVRPLIRKNKSLEEAGWEEALSLAADRLQGILHASGPNSLGGLASAKCTNEENYLFQKFFRSLIGTNNVDHCARLCHASSVTGLKAAFGSGAMTNPIRDVLKSRVILITGSNITENHPIFANYVVEAVLKHGARLIVADPRRICITRFADVWLRPKPGTNIAWLNGLMHIILQNGWQAAEYIEKRTEGFAELAEAVEEYSPKYVAGISGIPEDELFKAAELFGTLHPGSILYAMGITQHVSGTANVQSLANLAMLTGNVGLEGGGVNPLRGQNNVQGASDMGGLPNVLPGYQPVTDPESRRHFAASWSVDSLPAEPGLTTSEMAAGGGVTPLRGLYIMGENPVLSDPHQARVIETLKNLDFLVVQDIFLSDTARLADVVLPGACFAEKEGTFTNSERKVQRVRRAVPPPGLAREDLWIIADLAGRMGRAWDYQGAAEVMQEIASLTPSYGGLTYDRLEYESPAWPCPKPDHPGTPRLHQERFSRGRGRFHPLTHRAAVDPPSRDFPLILTTGRVGPHYHTGTMTRRGIALTRLYPEALAEINIRDAARLGVEDGDMVRIESIQGSIQAKARVSERTDAGVIFVPFHFRESPVNALTGSALDPEAGIPEYKVTAVRVKKAEG
ncbi:MAG: formate dehydrogenase subunit alpha [Desulfohalobiaceae bacterium]|nr:formate dehydrogenase subunit alpha [Desulfohalobiaceae bacterium]